MVWAMREEYPQPSTVQWYAAPSLCVSMCLRRSCWFLKLKGDKPLNISNILFSPTLQCM